MGLCSLCLNLGLFIRFLRQCNSGTQILVKTTFIDNILLNILQLLKLKVSQINKRGGPNKVRGMGKVSEINKRGGTFIKHQKVALYPKEALAKHHFSVY